MSDLFNTGVRPAIDAYLKAEAEKSETMAIIGALQVLVIV